jgi:hypothetical protein
MNSGQLQDLPHSELERARFSSCYRVTRGGDVQSGDCCVEVHAVTKSGEAEAADEDDDEDDEGDTDDSD